MPSNMDHIRTRVQKLRNELASFRSLLEVETEHLVGYREYIQHVEEAQRITQLVAQQIQERAHHQITGVVTACLQTIFGNDVGFKIRFERKRGRTEAELIIIENGHELADPINNESGGILDVAAFALRLSAILLRRPAPLRIIILDEAFKNVDEDNRPAIRAMLQELVSKFSFQFVNVTHINELKTGKVVRI